MQIEVGLQDLGSPQGLRALHVLEMEALGFRGPLGTGGSWNVGVLRSVDLALKSSPLQGWEFLFGVSSCP